MVVLVYIGISPQGFYKEHAYSDQDLESCLDRLGQMVNAGWQLMRVCYYDLDSTSALELPVESIDGQCMKEPIRQLSREWQALLTNS